VAARRGRYGDSMVAVPVGDLVRDWRQRRRLSQLDLALEAGVSARHLSFLETGRSRPSREMVGRLGAALGVSLREQNELLHAAGLRHHRPGRFHPVVERPRPRRARRLRAQRTGRAGALPLPFCTSLVDRAS